MQNKFRTFASIIDFIVGNQTLSIITSGDVKMNMETGGRGIG